MSEGQILEARKVSMVFGKTAALSEVDFSVRPGEIRALIGANGAGKSTLMKIIAGANPGFTGTVMLGGRVLNLSAPKAAQARGIRFVSQEVDTAIIPGLSVAENILMGDLPVCCGLVDRKTLCMDAEIALTMLGCPLDVNRRAAELTLAERQMVLLARVIARDSWFLLLDEPTAPLGAAETKQLFAVLRRLAKQQNVGIILVSHRLRELLQVCETMTVLRDGRLVDTFLLDGSVREADIVSMMSGKEIVLTGGIGDFLPGGGSSSGGGSLSGAEVLRVEGLNDAAGILKEVSLHVNKGEIVGIGGLSGAGKTELCGAIFGAQECTGGEVHIMGHSYSKRDPVRSVQRGIALIPEERRRQGIWPEESLRFNLTACILKECSRGFGFIRKAREYELAKQMIKAAGIRSSSADQSMQYLSGGNQQKAVIGKWLLTNASLFLFDEAVKGVDAVSKEEIFTLIRELAGRGKGILYLSCELEDLPDLCNRVYVMYNGKICRELEHAGSDELIFYAAGGGKDAD